MSSNPESSLEDEDDQKPATIKIGQQQAVYEEEGEKQNEEGVIHQVLSQAYGKESDQEQKDKEGTAVNWPECGQMLSDYTKLLLQALLFPTMFPFGTGNVTKKNQLTEVSLTESNNHLLSYGMKDEKERAAFPIAQHSQWMHWSQNTAERHCVN
jgi:hypothetical protein